MFQLALVSPSRLQRLHGVVEGGVALTTSVQSHGPQRHFHHDNSNGLQQSTAVPARTVPASSVAAAPPQALKPFSAMPGPRGYPLIGSLGDYLRKDGYKFTKMFEAMQDLASKYGPVYRERIGLIEHVVVSDPEEYAKVIRADGRTPERLGLLPMEYHRQKNGISLGLVNGQGEDWYRHRTAVNKKMLRPKEVLDYVPQMNIVADDFMDRLKRVRTSQGHVVDLEKELFKWAMESIGTVLFSERLGCLNEPPPARAQAFIHNLVGFFTLMQPLMYNVPIYKLWRTPKWKKFEMYADNVIDIGKSYVQKTLDKIEQQREWGVQPGEKAHKAEFLTYLITQKSLSPNEANLLAVDLLTGAVETTSTAILWTLYNLSKNPKAQKALFREICEVLPDRAPITAEVLPKLPYVKACLKETFRLYPIAFATSRIIDKDIELGGFFVPKGTHCQANLYGMGRDPKLFRDPLEFQPERWLRAEEEGVNEESGFNLSLANLPWGHGARMCIGRRFAEQEVYINVIKFVQNFRLEWHGEDLSPVLNTVMIPDRKVDFTFIPRD